MAAEKEKKQFSPIKPIPVPSKNTFFTYSQPNIYGYFGFQILLVTVIYLPELFYNSYSVLM